MAGHELVLKGMASHPMPITTNESHENVSDRIASIQAEFPNQGPREYEAHVLTIQSPFLVNNVVIHMQILVEINKVMNLQ
jgi:hypothetical protein